MLSCFVLGKLRKLLSLLVSRCWPVTKHAGECTALITYVSKCIYLSPFLVDFTSSFAYAVCSPALHAQKSHKYVLLASVLDTADSLALGMDGP